MDEHRDIDERIDAALEAMTRTEAPASHVVRVLARSGPGAAGPETAGRDGWLSPLAIAGVRPRWVLPIAATALVILAASWQIAGSRVALPQIARVDDTEHAGYPRAAWGAARDIDRPVLPPEMYWAMDPFAEFATLRPRSAPIGADTPRRPLPARVPPDDESGPIDAMVVPRLAGLQPIAMAPIEAAALDLEVFPASDAIELPAIALDAIVIAPLTDEEMP